MAHVTLAHDVACKFPRDELPDQGRRPLLMRNGLGSDDLGVASSTVDGSGIGSRRNAVEAYLGQGALRDWFGTAPPVPSA